MDDIDKAYEDRAQGQLRAFGGVLLYIAVSAVIAGAGLWIALR